MSIPDTSEFDRLLADYAKRGPCKMCADLQDCCPLCSAELGHALGVGLAALDFEPLDEIENKPLDIERN